MQRLLVAALTLGIGLTPVMAQDHPREHALGTVVFATGCNVEAQRRMNTAVAMLHSFWVSEARKTFESIASVDPKCGVAEWGVALTWFGNPFAGGPGAEGNRNGYAAAVKAVGIGATTSRDQAYIDAALALYRDHDRVDNRTRMRAYEAALGKLHATDSSDTESAVFHALWMVANAPPTDMTFSRQQEAAGILMPLLVKQPQHPGLAHYIIHAFDAPPLANLAIDAARTYAKIAPDAPHALHMPSHTFTRLGYWDESIEANRRSANQEPTAGAKAHAADYMVYAYLQQGRDDAALAVLREIGINPVGDDQTGISAALGGYNAIAMQTRYALERSDWAMAAAQPVASGQPAFVEAISRFGRALGFARSGNSGAARIEIVALNALLEQMRAAQEAYWSIVVDAQRKAAEAWVLHLEGKHADALRVAAEAADGEDLVQKHPVTPGPLIPARELLAELLLVHGKPAEALAAFEKTLEREPNRLRTLHGAAVAARAAGRPDVAARYDGELTRLIAPGSLRPELARWRQFVKQE